MQRLEFPGAKPPRCGLRARETRASPKLLGGSCLRARLPASGRARLRPGERAVPHRFVPAVKTVAASHKPPARALRKAPPAGPHLRGRFGAREAAGRSDGKQAVLADANPGRAKESFPGRTRTRELGGAFLTESAVEWKARGASAPAHAPWPRPAHARARPALPIFFGPAPLFHFREPGSVGRGGRGVARERGLPKRGGGGRS